MLTYEQVIDIRGAIAEMADAGELSVDRRVYFSRLLSKIDTVGAEYNKELHRLVGRHQGKVSKDNPGAVRFVSDDSATSFEAERRELLQVATEFEAPQITLDDMINSDLVGSKTAALWPFVDEKETKK